MHEQITRWEQMVAEARLAIIRDYAAFEHRTPGGYERLFEDEDKGYRYICRNTAIGRRLCSNEHLVAGRSSSAELVWEMSAWAVDQSPHHLAAEMVSLRDRGEQERYTDSRILRVHRKEYDGLTYDHATQAGSSMMSAIGTEKIFVTKRPDQVLWKLDYRCQGHP